MNNPAQHIEPASPEQLQLLRQLIAERGGTFAWPKSKAKASGEIKRLLGEKRTDPYERRREVKQVREAMANRGGATRVTQEEVSGYGSEATWASTVCPACGSEALIQRAGKWTCRQCGERFEETAS